MAISNAFAGQIANEIVQQVGFESAVGLMDRLVDLAVIKKAPKSPKDSITKIRLAVLSHAPGLQTQYLRDQGVSEDALSRGR